jgi:hypothetical protein
LTAITVLAITGCTGPAVASPAASKLDVVAPVPEQPASNAARASAVDSSGPSAADAECPALTAADITAITGQDVHPIVHQEFASVVQCGDDATADGQSFLGINMVKSSSQYQAESRMASSMGTYQEHHDLSGIGDEAVLFKGTTGRDITMRYLMARKGEKGVILMSLSASRDVTDEMLTKMLATAVSRI